MVIVILGLVIIVSITAIFRPLKRIAVSTHSVTVSKDKQVTVVAALVYKGWFSTSFKLVGGTITPTTTTSVFTVSPASVNTSAATPDAMITVTGVNKGTGTFKIKGSSNEGTHDPETIAVTVV